MARYNIGVSLIALTLIVLRRVTDGKISKRLQYGLWLLIPIFMLISPIASIKVTVPANTIHRIEESVIVNEEQSPSNLEYANTNNGQPQPVAGIEESNNSKVEVRPESLGASINWPATLSNIAWAVSGVILIAEIIYNIGFIAYCRRKRSFIYVDSMSNLKVYRFDHAGSPFLLGNKIYLSSNVIEDERMTEYAICHEYCHYLHGDMVWSVVRIVVLALNWYNPFIWIAFVKSGQDSELACDEAVLKIKGEDKGIEYGKVLLDLLSCKSKGKGDFTITTAMNGRNKEFMKSRITSIKRHTSYSFKPIVISLAIALMVGGCSLIEYNEEESVSEITEPTVSEGLITEETTSGEDVVIEAGSIVENDEEDEETLDELSGSIIQVAYTPEMGEFEDGYYTVALSYEFVLGAEVEEEDNSYLFYPWNQVEVDTEYVESLEVGDMIDVSGTDYADFADEFVVEFIEEYEAEGPFRRYGTDYSGEIIQVNDSFGIYFYKVEGTDTWKLFTYSDTPIVTYYDLTRLPVSEDYVIYDAVSPLFNTIYAAAEYTPEELNDITEFRDTTITRGYIDSINDFAYFNYHDAYQVVETWEYTVIKVENNEITEVYFWYHS